MNIIELESILQNMPERPDVAHKGTMGRLCAVTGSYGFSGAAVLSAKAALRAGLGLLYQVLPESIYPIFSTSVPEAVCVPVADSMEKTLSKNSADFILSTIRGCDAALVGCGLKHTDDTKEIVETIIRNAEVPLLLDADGINCISGNINILDEAKAPIVLTPHPKEFSRLTGIDTDDIQTARATAARDFSLSHKNVTLVLKGHRTIVANNGALFENRKGNSGMATGGSGDVLSGIIATFLAQGLSPFPAAQQGVFIHAWAGDIAAKRFSKTSMLPSDIISCLSDVFRQIENYR